MKRSLFEQDHDAFRESAREFVTRTIRPREEELAEQRFIDRDIWLEAGRNGFLGNRSASFQSGGLTIRFGR